MVFVFFNEIRWPRLRANQPGRCGDYSNIPAPLLVAFPSLLSTRATGTRTFRLKNDSLKRANKKPLETVKKRRDDVPIILCTDWSVFGGALDPAQPTGATRFGNLSAISHTLSECLDRSKQMAWREMRDHRSLDG